MDLVQFTYRAIQEERKRREQPLISYPSYTSLIADSTSITPRISDRPLLWKGAREPSSSKPVGLVLECVIVFSVPCSTRVSSTPSTPTHSGSRHCDEDSPPLHRSSSSSLSIRLSSPHLPSLLPHHHRSFSDPFSQSLPAMSHLSLAYGSETMKENEHLSYELPAEMKTTSRKRSLTREEREYLCKEDPLFDAVEPIDKIVGITGNQENPDLSSEVVLEVPKLQRSSNSKHLREEVLDYEGLCSRIVCKFVSVVNVGRSWKPRLVVITERFIRVMRDLDCNETKTEQKKEDLGAAVLCNSGKVRNGEGGHV